jgi:hypothetical protein
MTLVESHARTLMPSPRASSLEITYALLFLAFPFLTSTYLVFNSSLRPTTAEH